MENDEEINKKVLDLISILEKKKLVGINRVIKDYLVSFRFTKNNEVVNKNSAAQTGDALSSMGDSITGAFIGGKI